MKKPRMRLPVVPIARKPAQDKAIKQLAAELKAKEKLKAGLSRVQSRGPYEYVTAPNKSSKMPVSIPGRAAAKRRMQKGK